MSKQKDTVTTKDINKAAFRYMFMACNTFNYETQQGPAVVFGLNKLLRKIYPDDNEYLASLNNHFKYGIYQNKSKITNALNRLSKEAEKSAEKFYEMFYENNNNSVEL